MSEQPEKKPSRNTVVATMTTGVSPTGIAITPNNHFAYVANNNHIEVAGEDSVTVLNLRNNTTVTTIYDKSFEEPYRIAINAAGTLAYVANSNGKTVSILDIATNKVIGVIDGFDGPSGIAITPDGAFAYVNNYGAKENSGNGNTVNVIDLRTNKIVGNPITVGLAPASLAITPDGKFVYVINYVNGNPDTGTISVIRTRDNRVVDTIYGLFGPFSIAITPNGRFAYVTNFGSNNFTPIGKTVSVVDLHHNRIVDTITLGIQPAGVDFTPDGRLAYVTNYNALYSGSQLRSGQGTVNIIDTRTHKVLPPTIAVPVTPDIVVISSDGKFAYVGNYNANVVTVIKLR